MNRLSKYNLNFDLAQEYVLSVLDDANTLSIQLTNILNFNDGIFFTLLPKDVDNASLYEFKSGIIIN